MPPSVKIEGVPKTTVCLVHDGREVVVCVISIQQEWDSPLMIRKEETRDKDQSRRPKV